MERSTLISLVLMLAIGLPCTAQDVAVESAEGPPWWSVRHAGPQEGEPGHMPLISVNGSAFVNPAGDTVLFRGVSISDPDKIEKDGHWNKAHFEHVKELGAMMVRMPVHPAAWRERGAQQYLTLLDQGIDWSGELGMYVVIDWHSIGNLGMELFQDPMYDTSKKETYEFWRAIARRYSGNNTIAFYELFNEPTLYRGQLGRMPWSEWKKINENMISLIRAWDTETIPLVAGMDWAYDLTPLRTEPIEADGIGYVSHPYAFKRSKPWEPKWDEAFGFAAAQYPIILTEFGFGFNPDEPDQGNEYGTQIINYAEARGISWMGWVFDPNWWPSLFESYDSYKLTSGGEFFKRAMHGEVQD